MALDECHDAGVEPGIGDSTRRLLPALLGDTSRTPFVALGIGYAVLGLALALATVALVPAV